MIAQPLTPLKAKRASLTPKERAAMFLSQGGVCACGCGKPLAGKYIGEHTDPVALGNGEKPDCLLLHACSLRKTRADLKKIAKVKRQRLEQGQQKRRAIRKAEGKRPLIQTKPMQKGRGLAHPTLRKKMASEIGTERVCEHQNLELAFRIGIVGQVHWRCVTCGKRFRDFADARAAFTKIAGEDGEEK